MARLNAFKVNSQAIENGEWISPGDEYDDLRIKTRGLGDSYWDALNRKMRRAATPFGGEIHKIPNAIARDIRIECLIQFCLQDVQNLTDADGKAVDFAGFCDLLRNPDFGQLVVAAMLAAGAVGRIAAADKVDAAGN